VVAAIAYAAILFEANANVSNDVRLLGYMQRAGAEASSRDRASNEYGNIVLDGTGQSASATWDVQAPQLAENADTAGVRNEVFVVGSPSFSQPDGVAVVAILDRRASTSATIGTLHAVGKRHDPSQAARFVAIPPEVDSGMVFALPRSLSCQAGCTLRISVAHGSWNIQRVGLESELDPRIGAPLWTESFETFALTIALALAICVASYACLRYVLKPKANS
jgi:hypothetical protein